METSALLLESTRNCGQTPRVLLLLEELAVSYALRLRADGHFLATYGRPGPRLVDDDLTLYDSTPMLRHCARTRSGGRWAPLGSRELAKLDGWLECSTRLGLAVVALLREEAEQGAERRPQRVAEERVKLAGIVAQVEGALHDSDGEWLLDEFGLADCAMASLPRLSRFMDLARFPEVSAYCRRLELRPAFARACARLTAEPTPASADDVLEFWFGRAATTEAEVMAKAQRWFGGGVTMDREVQSRFGQTVEAALAGELDAWATTPRGRLALVIVLDQLTRNAFRGHPRTYAGDAKAQRLATEALDAGVDQSLSTVERLFLGMPLLHAEDVALQRRSLELAQRTSESGPALYAKGLAMHREQATKYLEVVTRFGRFPHRNATLGRPSTPEEEAFLRGWAGRAAPTGAPTHAHQG